jgi:hypothetical protein
MAMLSTANRAYRLRFSVEEKKMKLIAAIRLHMVTPPSIPLEEMHQKCGFWFTLQDSEGRPVYRRGGGNPFVAQRELFTGEKIPLRRASTEKGSNTVELLVPDIEGAKILVISASPAKNPFHPAEPIMKIQMRDISELAARVKGSHGRI